MRAAPDAEAGIARRHVLDGHGAVIRRVLPDPREVVLAERRAGDDAEAILREPRDGEIALDPAVLVQHRRVGDRADVARDPVVAEALEELRSALSGDLDLREARLVEQRGRVARRAVLGADGARPQPAGPAARPQRLVAVVCVPSNQFGRSHDDFSPNSAPAPAGARTWGRCGADVPLPLVAGVPDVVVGRVDLDRARERVAAAAVGRAEASRVHLPDVEARHAVEDPLGDELPHPTGPREAVAQKPAATQKPRTSVGPRMNSLSGVNASGPLIRRTDSISARPGTRWTAFSRSGSKRGQSSASSLPLKSAGMPSSDHGAGSRS